MPRLPVVADLLAKKMQQFAAESPLSLLATDIQTVEMRDIVDGSVAGSTNDAVLRFNSANDAVVGSAMSIVHSATLGDSISVVERGWYLVALTFSQAQSTTVKLGVSKNVAAAGLNSDPAKTIAGVLNAKTLVLPAGATLYHTVWGLTPVTEAEASASGGAVLRAHGTDGSDGVVPDATILDNTACHLFAARLADLIA